MFNFFKESFEVLSPVDGNIISISEISDKIFSRKIVGDGVAIQATGDVVKAPIDGRLAVIFDTNHAFIIVGKNGVELLVHIGINTLELNGEGFERLVKEGDYVKTGEPIIKLDRKIIVDKGYDLTVPVIITNVENIKEIIYTNNEYVRCGESLIMKCRLK